MPEPLVAEPAEQLLRPQEFELIGRLAYEKFGLELRNGKQQLVTARLSRLMRQGGFRSFQQYYRHVLSDASGNALVEMIDALTTNFTSFYREPAHFEFLRQSILPAWRRRDALKVWSAACSSGEEPYSLAFCLLSEGLDRAQILATDISTRALAAAERGIYPAERFEHLEPSWVRRFLLKGSGRFEGSYRIKPEVRQMVFFRRVNLIEPLTVAGPFALILCRNVMIYFNRTTQESVVGRLAGALEPGGYLFVGHAESLTGMHHGLEYVRPAIYRKPGGGRA